MRNLLLFILLVFCSKNSHGFETDQYTLSRQELQDTGPQVSRWIFENLEAAVLESKSGEDQARLLNRFLRRLATCNLGLIDFQFAQTAGHCISRHLQNELSKQNTPSQLFVFRPAPSIYTRESTPGLLARFYDDEAPDKDYFWRAFSDTVRFYDVVLGLDKIGHFLKLGRDYYLLYLKSLSQGLTIQEAEQVPVREIGVHHEMNLYGKRLSGVFSNADLATNFAGFRFYQSLFSVVSVYGKKIGPLLIKGADGRWMLRGGTNPETLLSPFITVHMNEALNPSWITDAEKVPAMKAEIQKRCSSWKAAFPNRNLATYYDELLETLLLWDGIQYGYKRPLEGPFTLSQVCLR